MPQNNENNANNRFANVFICGSISGFHFKELKKNRSIMNLQVCISNDSGDNSQGSFMSEDIEVIVDNKKLLHRVKNKIELGVSVIIKGRIVVKFVSSENNVSKKFNYISARDILFKNNINQTKESEEKNE